MAAITVTATGMIATPPPNGNILNDMVTLAFQYSGGSTKMVLTHQTLNIIRALFKHSIDYPNSMLPPIGTASVNIPLTANITYMDIGDMIYSGVLTLAPIAAYNVGSMTLTISTFHFDLSPYIEYDDDGNEIHIEPYYSYYEGKDSVIINFTKDVIDTICTTLDSVLPYQRFADLNADIYPYINQT